MKDTTRAVVSGRAPAQFEGVANPPVFRASTIISQTVAEWDERKRRYMADEPVTMYGLDGTPTKHLLQTALAELEGGYRCAIQASGLSACMIPLLAYASTGGHILLSDSVYLNTRQSCNRQMARLGIEVEYYDPMISPKDLRALLRPNTQVLFLESPGSLTFEVQDVPALAETAHQYGDIKVLLDNTWGTPLYFKPFTHGVDVSIQATTKYIAGHSDVIMGSVTTTQPAWSALRQATADWGQTASPDDCYLAARGLRTMPVRLERQYHSGLIVAEYFAKQPEVEAVLHPAMPGCPGHALWKRDFLGACGLFGVVLRSDIPHSVRDDLINHLELYGIGASWGGYESLVMPFDPRTIRSTNAWEKRGPCFRIHVGLEDPDDLCADLGQAFNAIRANR